MHRPLARIESLESRRLFAATTLGLALTVAKATQVSSLAHAPKKPGKPDLQSDSDDGVRNNDNVTSIRMPLFDVDRVDANCTVQLLRDGVVVASVYTAAGG